MIEPNSFKNTIIIKGDSLYSIVGIGFSVMAIIGLKLLLDMDPNDNILAYFFIIVWISIVLILSINSFITAGKKLILCDKGIYSKTLISEDFLDWSEVEDWGISYAGSSQGGGEIFYLYFSKNIFPIKNARKKKLKGKVIKIEVFGAEYKKIINSVIPYCKKKTLVDPFVGESVIEY